MSSTNLSDEPWAGKVDPFWERVDQDEHWFVRDSDEDFKDKSWELIWGPIPDGFFVLRECDEPHCISPYHLFLGNNRDWVLMKKRELLARSTGKRVKKVKLTSDDYTVIRETNLGNQELAEAFSLPLETINKIKEGIIT